MWCEANCPLEKPDQLKRRQIDGAAHSVEGELFAKLVADQRLDGRDGTVVTGRDWNARPFATVPPE